jgi:hypothetical protein
MPRPTRPPAATAFLAGLWLLAGGAHAQTADRKGSDVPAEAAVEAIPPLAALEPAEVTPFHPLYRAFEKPPGLAEVPAAQEYRGKATLFLSLKLDETGKVLQAEAIDPPLRGLAPAAAEVALRWTFEPARKDGKAVRTWAACGVDLVVDLERPVFTSFALLPVGKGDPLPAAPREPVGDEALLRFPSRPDDPDPAVVSIEEVDLLPAARKAPWKIEPVRLKSRFSAILQVSPAGAVERVIATGTAVEPFILAWVRTQAARWKISPALDGETPQRSYMNLDLAAEYEVTRAKESAKRILKKNLKGPPAG